VTAQGTGPRVTVDLDRCVGSGDCAMALPQAFALDDADGLARVLDGAASVDPALLRRAAANCPSAAIGVEEDAE
jgi:ferredoxin